MDLNHRTSRFGDRGFLPTPCVLSGASRLGAPAKTVEFGESTKDEMCLALLWVYPAGAAFCN